MIGIIIIPKGFQNRDDNVVITIRYCPGFVTTVRGAIPREGVDIVFGGVARLLIPGGYGIDQAGDNLEE